MATAYYVSETGNDRNNGLSENAAFRTLQQAAELTRPGDTVYIMNGTYTQANQFDNVLTIRNSGTSSGWITYTNYPGHTPKLLSRNWNAIEIEGASYIVINGLKLEGNNDNISLNYAMAQKNNLTNPLTSGNGISVKKSSRTGAYPRHILIRNNEIYKFGGAGIQAGQGDYVTIENNSVHDNAWYSPYGNSGISVGGWNSDNNQGYKIIIRGNTVYRNQQLVPWYKVGAITDGNGIIVDTNRNSDTGVTGGPYGGRTLIENNIVTNNGGRGIHTYKSNHVDVLHNTTFQNSLHPAVKDGEITTIESYDVQVFNNILYGISDAPANKVSNSSNVIYDYNLAYGGTGFNPAGGISNWVGLDPLFVNPATGDFSLRDNSPALDRASSGFQVSVDRFGTPRPQGSGRDLGAVEFKVNSSGGTGGTGGSTGGGTGGGTGGDTERVNGIVRSGDSRANSLRGTLQNDLLDGKGGNDYLLGRDGNDRLIGGGGSDLFNGERGNDRLISGAGNDSMTGGLGNDIFAIGDGAGRDRIRDFKDGIDKIELLNDISFGSLKIQPSGRDVMIQISRTDLVLISNISIKLITAADFV
ncbi:MAG: right-handed parallel beta-helix repeat-containing protein [Elainella sp. Prado103]|jgi:hypothetical protein|nr:right-handed parallel beta-helix repeat-containing protein [Elainella sp. Prado103]